MRSSTVVRTRRYPPLGRCMYCLAAGVTLSEEHLIPKSLGGRWTLRDAVCDPCRVRTGRLEQATLADDFLVPRTLLAMKRRRARRGGPKRFQVAAGATACSPGGRALPGLSANDYPRGFALPHFAPAGLLAGIDRADGAAATVFVPCRLDVGTPRHEAPAPAAGLRDPHAYGYAVAKWAYSLAVAERGLDCCDTRALRQLLAGERSDVFNFVGSPERLETPRGDQLHGLSLHECDGWLTLRLSLLESAGAPAYEVVIGAVSPRRATQSTSSDAGMARE